MIKNRKKLLIVLIILIQLIIFLYMQTDHYKINSTYEYEINDEKGEATITEYKKKSYKGILKIPAEINGYPVTAIGEAAFLGSHFKKVTLPDTVVDIKDLAFCSCAFVEIDGFDNIKNIGYFSFGNCDNLNSIDLSEIEIDIIDGYAFSDCNGLKDIKLPKSIKILNEGLFRTCNFEEITCPENIEQIRPYAFRDNENLKNIYLPKHLKAICEEAFYNCKNLGAIKLPENVEYLGSKVFGNCISLSEIEIPASVSEIESDAFDGIESQLTICGAKGSFAEEYAEKNNIKFEAIY